tara:strand:- start:260 stop:1198 length:939 start_codon:yes stop_codon:yes gene_type:complete
MIIINDRRECTDETDWEYDSRVFWWLSHWFRDFPDVYRVSSFDIPDLNLIKSEKYILLIKGNEHHLSFDNLYKKDKRLVAIIKNYPHLKNVASDPEEVIYEVNTTNTFPAVDPLPEDERTINIPLGYCNGFRSAHRLKRTLDRSFSGIHSQVRDDFLKTIELQKPWGPTDHICTYQGFGGVYNNDHPNFLNREEYARLLGHSKFALCPGGASPETYRISEAAASGCIIIRGILPNTEYYNTLPSIICPVIKESDSDSLKRHKINILDSRIKTFEKSYSKIVDYTIDWYNKWIDPQASAKRIANKLRSLNVVS